MNARILAALGLGVALRLATAAHADAPPGRYVVIEGGDVVHDTVTGLEWIARSLGPLEHAPAQAACAALKIGAFDDFKLPRRDQLITLVDLSARVPEGHAELAPTDDVAVDVRYFDAQRGRYWTDTSARLGPPPAVEQWFTVSAERGDVATLRGISGVRAWVRCVRVARPGQP